MRKLSVIIAAAAVLAVIGCATGGGGGAAPAAGDPLIVDLSTLKLAKIQTSDAYSPITVVGEEGLGVRNTEPIARKWGEVLLLFPEPLDVSGYSRVTINCKYFNADGDEINQGDTNAMVTLVRDINGDKRGPEMGAGGNVALKEMNVGGFSGGVSKERGSRIRNDATISSILFQSCNDNVKFIELTEIVFHNGDFTRD